MEGFVEDPCRYSKALDSNLPRTYLIINVLDECNTGLLAVVVDWLFEMYAFPFLVL